MSSHPIRVLGLPALFVVSLVSHPLAKPVAPGAQPFSFSEDFEAYAGHADFEKSWKKTGAPAHQLDPATGRDSKRSVQLRDPDPAARRGVGVGEGNRFYRDLPKPLTPSDDAPVTFSVDLHLDAAGAADSWSGAWQSVDLRGYAGGTYGQGALTGIVSLGTARASIDPHSPEFFQSRLFTAPTPDIRQQYYTLDHAPNAPKRSPGWHTLTARVGATSTTYLVDGVVVEIVPVGLPGPLTTIVLGADVGAGGHVFAVDNIAVRQAAVGLPGNPPAAR